MSGIFGYSREAVRVKVKKCEGLLQPEFRKFSVDPQITSFEVLQSILGKAFDIKGEFTICYRTYDVYGHETYLPLLSDWDLDAAFLKAHNTSVVSGGEPCLCLRVDMKPFEESSDDWDVPSTVSVITQFRTGTAQEAKPSQRLPGIIMNQVERTFNMVQRAFNLGEDANSIIEQPPRPPLSDAEFRKFLDPVGQITHSKDLRSTIYLGGIDPSLRKVVWKHILNVYPEGMCGRERMDYIKRKASEYISLRDAWKDVVQRGPVTGDLAYTTGMVRKDVLRTDRHHKFYAGSDDNQNIASLFNILTTYALNHPKVSYCQGMSDLASPLLVTMGDEAHAYICFCALMSRLNTNFMLDGIAMTQKFTHLAEGLMYYDPEFYAYLKSHQADDLLFCYRWLLLEMKREFAFEDSLRMLEVLWSSLPAAPPKQELPLYESRFYPPSNATPPVSPLMKTPRENAYTKVCALRRQTSSISLASYMGKVPQVKRQNFSLDENVCRLSKHLTDQTDGLKYRSLDDDVISLTPKSSSNSEDSRPRSVSPLEPKSDSQVVVQNRINPTTNSLSSSMHNLLKPSPTVKKPGHFKDLKERIAAGKIFSSLDRLDMRHSIKEEAEVALDKKHTISNSKIFSCPTEGCSAESEGVRPGGKIVRNLNEFLNFASPRSLKKSSRSVDSDNPIIITLTSSSSSAEGNPEDNSNSEDKKRSLNSENPTITNSASGQKKIGGEDFDGSSPDDSQEYFPMTTSMTRELRLELENLDRQVFGNKFNNINLEDSESESCSSSLEHSNKTTRCDCVVSKSDIPSDTVTDTVTEVAEIGSTPRTSLNSLKPNSLKLNQETRLKIDCSKQIELRKKDDIFLWENPLHASSPSLTQRGPNLQTPDEQADLEYDEVSEEAVKLDVDKSEEERLEEILEKSGDIILEARGSKSATPIRLVHRALRKKKDQADPSDLKPKPKPVTVVNGCNLLYAATELKPSESIQAKSTVDEPRKPEESRLLLLPAPKEFGGGNPFLMFLCLTVLLQHRETIIRNGMDYNEMAMHFDKMVRKHDVNRVLNQARQMYAGYMKQHSIAQQNNCTAAAQNGDCDA